MAKCPWRYRDRLCLGGYSRRAPSDGRIRFWGKIVLAPTTQARYLRVVTLEDGETIHNAFFDRNFREVDR